MSAPLKPAKTKVALAPGAAPRVSKIRRDPPPQAAKLAQARIPEDLAERETLTAVVGILLFAIAICVLVLAAASYEGWTPREYTLSF